MSPLVFQRLNYYNGFIMSLNILLVDRHPHIQKTLRYFLHHYSPVIQNAASDLGDTAQSKNLDIIFIDSDQVKEKALPPAQKNADSPPVVLLSYSDSFLKQNRNNPLYHAQLKKPIEPQKLHQIVEDLVPKAKELKLTPHLKFYNTVQPEAPLFSSPPTAPSSPLKQKGLASEKKTSPLDIFDSEGLSLTDEKEFTSIQQTTSNFKIMSKEVTSSSALQPPKPSLTEEKSPAEPFTIKKITISTKIKPPAQEERSNQHFSSKNNSIQKKLKLNNQDEPAPAPNEALLDETHIHPLYSTGRTTLQPGKPQLKHIETAVDKRFQKNWQDLIDKKIKKDLQDLISKELHLIFKNDFKETFRTKGLEAIRSAAEKVCEKIIPDLVKPIINKNEKETKK